MTGAVSAIERNRASLSLRTFVLTRPSTINAATNISGTDMAIRNSWSETTGFSELVAANRPRPWTAPAMEVNATNRIAVLTPGGPNRKAAQSTNGSGRYTRAGMLVPAVGQRKTRAQTAINARPSNAASVN